MSGLVQLTEGPDMLEKIANFDDNSEICGLFFQISMSTFSSLIVDYINFTKNSIKVMLFKCRCFVPRIFFSCIPRTLTLNLIFCSLYGMGDNHNQVLF